jgi:hypothetical protein
VAFSGLSMRILRGCEGALAVLSRVHGDRPRAHHELRQPSRPRRPAPQGFRVDRDRQDDAQGGQGARLAQYSVADRRWLRGAGERLRTVYERRGYCRSGCSRGPWNPLHPWIQRESWVDDDPDGPGHQGRGRFASRWWLGWTGAAQAAATDDGQRAAPDRRPSSRSSFPATSVRRRAARRTSPMSCSWCRPMGLAESFWWILPWRVSIWPSWMALRWTARSSQQLTAPAGAES